MGYQQILLILLIDAFKNHKHIEYHGMICLFILYLVVTLQNIKKKINNLKIN